MRLTRRRLMLATAATGTSIVGAAQALTSDGHTGKLFGGDMALSEAYKFAEGPGGAVWIGPDSAKSNVSASSGNMYFASDTQVDYYGDGGSWIKMGVGSSQEPVPSVTADQADITGETFTRLTRGSDSSSLSSGTWTNAYDGTAQDSQGEVNGSAQFSPAESGWYEIHINAAISTGSSGDRIRARIRNVTDGSDVGEGDDIGRQEVGGSGINSISASVHVNLDSSKTYEIQVQDLDSSFFVSQFTAAGVIKRSVVHP